MRIYKIPTNSVPMSLVVSVVSTSPSLLRIEGKCSDRRDTTYFDMGFGTNESLFIGEKEFTIPLPMSPKSLLVRAYDSVTGKDVSVKIKKFKAKQLPINIGSYNRDVSAFVDFAKDICQNIGSITPNSEGEAYTSPNGKFKIRVGETITDNNGKYIETPARISRATGNMEVSLKHFREYTIPMRMYIMCHEMGHYFGATTDEFEADRIGIAIYLDAGFPKSEVIRAFTRVLKPSNREGMARARKILELILETKK